METVSVQISAAQYAAIYARHGEETSDAINGCLNQLVSPDGSPPGSPKYPRPSREDSETGKVWVMADRLKKSGTFDRQSVVKACVEAGINVNTASTQYSYWKKSNL